METRTDPWSDLAPAHSSMALSARRVAAECRWNFFWARGLDHRCALVLQVGANLKPHSPLPKLRGIECALTTDENPDSHLLCLKLQDSTLRDLFHRLCLDIIACASEAVTEADALERTLSRTWRWHHLLRGGGDNRLSPEEQKGLIGELHALECLLMPSLSMMDAVSAWHGPLGSPKDFEISRIAIEAKARSGVAVPCIYISSEHQLDDNGTDALFLHVCEIDHASVGSVDAFNLTALVSRVLGVIRAGDPMAADLFETLLNSAGFRWGDDYSSDLWMLGATRLYHVVHGFPRITAHHLVSGVSGVRYSVSLADCEPFTVSKESFAEHLVGGHHGN